ncbi:MAG: prepilin peptidase [Planctomycetes bacterium]|nr:prepilin peptidase [Planctomycetota bacterium]
MHSIIPGISSLDALLEVLYQEGHHFRISFWLLAFAFGACMGSFLQASAYRIPRGISLISPSSSCPQCKRKLNATTNLPILGWLFLRGRCEFCLVKIPCIYLLMEIIMGLVSLGLWYVHVNEGMNIGLFFSSFFLFSWLILLAHIDISHYILPDSLTVLPFFVSLFFISPSSTSMRTGSSSHNPPPAYKVSST